MNAQTNLTPEQMIRDLYLERRHKNQSYSARAFARDLGISQSMVSLIMSGKRPLTLKQAYRISAMLSLRPEVSNNLVAHVLSQTNSKTSQTAKGNSFFDLEVDHFKMLSDWYHIAVLDLSLTRGFQSKSSWIARRLGITSYEAKDALDRLLRLGLLKEDGNGVLTKSKPLIYFNTTDSVQSIRAFHTQMLGKAQQELKKADQKSFSKREISGITFAVRADKVESVKRKLRSALKKIVAEISNDEKGDEVYHLAAQFFPLTIRRRKK